MDEAPIGNDEKEEPHKGTEDVLVPVAPRRSLRWLSAGQLREIAARNVAAKKPKS